MVLRGLNDFCNNLCLLICSLAEFDLQVPLQQWIRARMHSVLCLVAQFHNYCIVDCKTSSIKF